ncbi:dTDP-4-dehydrorhamnose reductase [Pasteurella langaaensis DSM 22999]|uniref:dTDP-4-dehydrorhamnose reductase n=1 Tax=Alitibacter langaaensis DSM 22999 TaxID=1122935 RepID=A0A2U0THE3_9PAST|nr:dTDP-4-dehydrorhamnose reductase [Pasteurella langaaensis DSM 22999]
MARFLITGAKGQVGSCLVPQLQGKAEVLALARDELDITNQSAVKNAIISFHPDIIINAAAYTAVDRAETDIKLAEAINISGAQFLAGAANEIDAAILHISTDYVFDGTDTHPYKEDEQTRPQSVY